MLSCSLHSAFVYDRGGKQQIGALTPVTRVKWARDRDDISMATVYIHSPGPECSEVLGIVESGRHELVIFRGTERVWEGPITRISYKGNSVEFEARDVMHYVNRTAMHNEYDNRYPNTGLVLDRVKRILTAEMARKEALDPPIDIMRHMNFIYAEGTQTYSGRHYDVRSTINGIRSAKNVEMLNAALTPMRIAYGFSSLFGVPSHTSENGLTWTTPSIGDPKLKESAIEVVNSLAMYPPEFARSLDMVGFYFTTALNLEGRTGTDIGGAAYGGRQFIDIENHSTSGGGYFGSAYILHHEFNHIIYMANLQAVSDMYEEWNAANPPGFQYDTNYTQPPFPGEAPTGFVRDYGRYSMMEDVAEFQAALFSPSFQSRLKVLVEIDPYVAKKVALFKAWLADVSGGLISGDNYYKAIHGGSFQVAGPSGVIDASTAAHTLPYEMSVFEHIDNYAARGGLDYCVVGRSVLFFDVNQKIGQTPMVTGDDFIGDPIITQYGMELATRVIMTDGKGNHGAAGGTDDYYGEWEVLHQAYDENAAGADENDIPTVAEMRSQAQRALGQGQVPPLVVRIPDNTRLNPNGVLAISDLVPGVWIPMTADLPGKTLSQMQKLDKMSVEETSDGEVITVTLSPAIADKSFVEEEV